MSDIRQWLEELGLSQYADAFEENRIDLGMLSDLDRRFAPRPSSSLSNF